jgi:hypothetical protein
MISFSILFHHTGNSLKDQANYWREKRKFFCSQILSEIENQSFLISIIIPMNYVSRIVRKK